MSHFALSRRGLIAGGLGLALAPPVTHSFLIKDVRVFDGVRVIEKTSVLVVDGRIAGSGLNPPGIRTYDGHGRTLLPGLMDAHVHTDEDFRADALRFGVTTELDMFGPPEPLADARRQRRSFGRTSRADLWSSGIGVTVPGGHPHATGWDFPRVGPGDDIERFVADRVREGSDYIKIIIDDGNGTFPTLTPEQVRAAVRAAHRHGKLAVAHAERLPHVRTAVAAGVDGMVHVAIDGDLDDGLVDAIRRLGAFVVPTIAVIDCGASADDLLADPRIAPLLSQSQADALRSRNPRPCKPDYRRDALANTRRLFQAGVPILAGTDAPLPGTADGPSLLAAIAYLVEAGLPPQRALAAATSVPANAFGLPDRGRIRPGQRADLLLVNGDPTTNITALRDIAAVFKNGYAIDRSVPK